ncbi:hypothetical protein C2E23DRAFT_298346 [Lenzites betulinus]|nr:hypothetical protein C2E23DRAFT_298346 [Lenzites betulinus]
MFTRVLTRTFLFRRGQHADTAANRDKPARQSRPSSPESQPPNNILQPSAQNEVASNNGQTHEATGDDKEVVLRCLSTAEPLDVDDENSPALREAKTAKSDGLDHVAVCHRGDESVDFAVQDESSSFILVKCSEEPSAPTPLAPEDDAEEFMTPELNDPSLFESLAFVAEALAYNTPVPELGSVTEESGVEPTAIKLPPSEPSSSSGGALSAEYPHSASTIEPYSLQTCLLSDITEAEEPSMSNISCKDVVVHPVVAVDSEGIEKLVLSFSPFGSSYASTHLDETSESLSQEPVVAPALDEEIVTNNEVEVEGSLTSDGGCIPDDAGAPQLPLPATLPPPCGHEVTIDRPETTSSKDTISGPASPERPCRADSAEDVAGTVAVESHDPVATCGTDAVDSPAVPAPSTYADAMNLAIQFPEISSRLLSEPLASAGPSICPTPARPVSPIPAPGSSAVDKSKNGSAHSTESPNWAQDKAESTAGRPSRARGRGNTQPSGNSRRASRRGSKGKRSAKGSNASKTPPANTPILLSHPPAPGIAHPRKASPAPHENANPPPIQHILPKEPVIPNKPSSQQPIPDGSCIQETVSSRSLRKEKAETWLHRVSSWVEQTSVVQQTSPNTHFTPTGSSGVSPVVPPPPSNAAKPSGKATGAVVTSPAPSISPGLNPHAPVWEFRPHQRAATICQVQATANSGASPANPPGAHPSQGPLVYNAEEDLQRLRIMLHESGLEDRRLSFATLTQPQARPMPNPPIRSQSITAIPAAAHPGSVQNGPPKPRPDVPQGIIPPFNSVGRAGGGVHQTTQPHDQPQNWQRGEWQCSDGGVLRFPGLSNQKAPWKYEDGVLRFPGLGKPAGPAIPVKPPVPQAVVAKPAPAPSAAAVKPAHAPPAVVVKPASAPPAVVLKPVPAPDKPQVPPAPVLKTPAPNQLPQPPVSQPTPAAPSKPQPAVVVAADVKPVSVPNKPPPAAVVPKPAPAPSKPQPAPAKKQNRVFLSTKPPPAVAAPQPASAPSKSPPAAAKKQNRVYLSTKPSPTRAQVKPVPAAPQPSQPAVQTPSDAAQNLGGSSSVSVPPAAASVAPGLQNVPQSAGQAQKACQPPQAVTRATITIPAPPVSGPPVRPANQRGQSLPANPGSSTATSSRSNEIELPRVIYGTHGWTVNR